jgi:hypothetical protein
MNEPGNLQLNVHGPFVLCSRDLDILENCPLANEAGIYFFGVRQLSGKFAISYVGETSTSFYKRLKEHVIQTLGGNYRVCEPEAMKKGKQVIVWNGLWRKGTRNQMPEFLRRYSDLAPVIRASLLVQKVFIIPFQVERRLRQRIEGSIASALRDDPSASILLPEDIRFCPRRKDEEPVLVEIRVSKIILGLPERIYEC